MELSSSSDSEDCQLYTKAAENVEIRRKQLEIERQEFEKLIFLVPEKDIDKVTKIGYNYSDEDLLNITVNDSVTCVSSDSDDNIPLAALQRKIQLKSRQKSTRKRKSKPSTRSKKRSTKPSAVIGVCSNNFNDGTDAENQPNVIVFDDDTGYPTSFAPIDFSSRKKTKANNNTLSQVSQNSTINLDSDEDLSFDSEGIVTISIEWYNDVKCTRKEFKVRQYQKLEFIYEELSKQEGVTPSRIMLLRNYEPIKPTDTPSSLNLKYYGALTGTISKTDLNYNADPSKRSEERVLAEGEIAVKLQLETKQCFQLTILKTQKMSVLYEKCCEELNCPIDKLKIKFEGEVVDRDERPTDLDLEGGEVFHVYIKK